MQDFISGIKYVTAGFSLITRPGIRLYMLIPMLINAILFAGVITFGAHLLGDFIDTTLTGWLEWLRWLLWPLFVIIALTIVFFCFSIVANLIAAPFNGFLAEATEVHLTSIKLSDAGNLKQLPADIIKAIKSEFKKFTYFSIRAIPLLILFVIPLIQIAAPFLWLIFGAWMLALEYMDFPMGNHGVTFPKQRQTLWSKRKITFGFGIGALILTLIPVANFIAIPVIVCGATKMWVERIRPA
jgi:CysZ protein